MSYHHRATAPVKYLLPSYETPTNNNTLQLYAYWKPCTNINLINLLNFTVKKKLHRAKIINNHYSIYLLNPDGLLGPEHADEYICLEDLTIQVVKN